MIYQLRFCFDTSTLLEIYKTYTQLIYQYSVLINSIANKTDLKRLESRQRFVWRNFFEIEKRECLKHFRDNQKLSLIRELHVYDLFNLMVKTIRQFSENKKLHEYIREQEITDTIKTGKTRKKHPQ